MLNDRTRDYVHSIADADISTTGGLLTQREVRLLCLAELNLQPNEVLWDIGAGSGSISISAAHRQPAATVYAIERRPQMVGHIRENLRRFPAPNVQIVEGHAPEVCADLPSPHAVVVGGSGGQLLPILHHVRARLPLGGRLVLLFVTLDNLHQATHALPTARVVLLQVSVGVQTANALRFAAQNPIFLMTWRHTEGA